ncbi:Lsr2 family DNA-binding protein [Micromonospora deserti]|uniref:Lsr2 family DNA-binding protein n=1 Tax=Micromonospora deserti TaxID=2070366 RepID=UPI0013146123|nr:histone-like nucleoid-structuring protein Lsr2 [Micromonospora deserti]
MKGPNGLVVDLDPVVASGLVGGGSGEYSYVEDGPEAEQEPQSEPDVEQEGATVQEPESDPEPAPEQKTAQPKPADVRRWAKENDVECPARGSIPESVVDAYKAATETE